MLTRADALAHDAEDGLAFARARFALPPGLIYLDGNSLGALPRRTPARVADTVTKEWGEGLIRSWNDAGWIDAPARLGARIARLIGAGGDEVIVTDSTSINVFKLAAAALALRPGRRVIVTETGNFPTDLYMLQGLSGLTGCELRVVPRDGIAAALDETVALLLLTHTHYRSGSVFDMAAMTAAAQAAGALACWDLSHSAGALAVDLNGANADMAVGCGYKYLNGGPGAPAFAFVATRHHDSLSQPLSGWMGHAAPFAFVPGYAPAAGVDRFLCGTPAILSMAALECGIASLKMPGVAGDPMPALRAKSIALTALFIDLVEARCGDALLLATPRDPALRGSQVSFHARGAIAGHGYPVMRALIERGVVGDFRKGATDDGDILRFGFTPAYLRYVDAFDAVDIVADVVASGHYREERFNVRAAVT